MNTAQKQEQERHQRDVEDHRRVHPFVEDRKTEREGPEKLITAGDVDHEEAGEEPTGVEAEGINKRVII